MIPTPDQVTETASGWWVWFAVPDPDGDGRILRPVAPPALQCKIRGCHDARQVASWYCARHQPDHQKGGTATSTHRRRGGGEVTPPAPQPSGRPG